MCYGQVDPRLLEREAMDRLRAARPRARTDGRAEAGPPPELMGSLPGLAARLRHALGHLVPSARMASPRSAQRTG